MNKSIFYGTLTKDFDVNTSQSGMKVGRSAMALNRGKDKDGNDKGADFINLVAFGNTAEFFEKFGKKGRKFVVECHVQTGSYEKDGKKIYTTDFVVDNKEFGDSKQTAEQPAEQTAEQTAEQPALASDGFIDVSGAIDEELPFR